VFGGTSRIRLAAADEAEPMSAADGAKGSQHRRQDTASATAGPDNDQARRPRRKSASPPSNRKPVEGGGTAAKEASRSEH
jgi:hypothetical protein